MTLAVSLTIDQLILKIGGWMVDPTNGVVPVGTQVIRGPINRAAQPPVDHVIITPVHRKRLRTNIETDHVPAPGPGPGDGTVSLEAGMQVDLHVDFYGITAEGWSMAFTTMWRSAYAVAALAPELAPLYADEARMMPAVVGEEQYLERWLVRAMLQYNPVTTTPQQYAASVIVTPVNVDERYPP